MAESHARRLLPKITGLSLKSLIYDELLRDQSAGRLELSEAIERTKVVVDESLLVDKVLSHD